MVYQNRIVGCQKASSLLPSAYNSKPGVLSGTEYPHKHVGTLILPMLFFWQDIVMSKKNALYLGMNAARRGCVGPSIGSHSWQSGTIGSVSYVGSSHVPHACSIGLYGILSAPKEAVHLPTEITVSDHRLCRLQASFILGHCPGI